MTDSRDTMRWVRRGAFIALVVIGWVFIAWQNHFHITAPLAFVCLGYLAVLATVYNLWRTGAAAVDGAEEGDDSTWARPAGALGELEREKRTLLKAIKEAEFDHQMGKLSKRDADEMIHGYRARAIEVIKQIDQLGLGAAGTVREQILREVRARVQLDSKAARKAGPEVKAKAGGKRAEKAAGPEIARAAAGAAEPPAAAPAGPGSEAVAQAPDESADDAAKLTEAVPAAAGSAAAGSAAAAAQVPRDDELDADSTTALEPRHDDPAKEATP